MSRPAPRPPRWRWVDPARAMLRRIGGQGLVEYGLILGLGTLLGILVLVVFGDQVADIVQWIGRTVDSATGG